MLLAGSILDRTPGHKYAAGLRFAELSLRAPLPRAKTLCEWRAQLPDGFALALRAPTSAVVSARGPLRIDETLEHSLKWLLDAAQSLAVCAVVLPTPADLAPGARSRELLTTYAARLPRVANRSYVWAPRGLWQPEETAPLCADLGLVLAFDPLQTPRPAGGVVYAELRALGHRKNFSHAALETALDVITAAEFDTAYVSVDSDRGFDIARRLTAIAAERGLAPTLGAPSPTDGDGDGGDEDDEDDDP